MKLFFSILLWCLPLYGFAWSGSGDDYKRGYALNVQSDQQLFQLNEDGAEACDRISLHKRNIEFFQSLGKSFQIEIPDPSDYLKNIIEIPPY